MTLQGQAPGEKKLNDLFGGGTFWENVDWSRTQAYAMGLGQIYVNLEGPRRPGHRRARRRIEARCRTRSPRSCSTLTDPTTGAPIVTPSTSATTSIRAPFLEQRRGAAGRLRRRLPRVVADHARRLAAGHRLSEHEEVERRPRRRSTTRPRPARSSRAGPLVGRDAADHRHRADRVEVLRRADTRGHRWQAALLKVRAEMRTANADARMRSSRRHASAGLQLRSCVRCIGAVALTRSRPTARGPRRSRGARPSGCRRCSAKPTGSRPGADAPRRSAQAGARAPDQGRGAEAGRRRGREHPGRAGRDGTRRSKRSQATEDSRARPELRRGWSRSTSSARRATCACCCPRPTSAASDRRRARSPRSRKLDRDRVAAHQRTLDELEADARDARGAQRTRGRRCAADAEQAQIARRSAPRRRRRDLIRDIDRRRDLNAQLAGELQAAQQKLQATLRDLATGAPVPSPRRCPSAVPRRSRLAGAGQRPPPLRRQRPDRPAVVERHRDRGAEDGAPVSAVHDGAWPLPTPSPASATWSSWTTGRRPSACTAICSRCRSRKAPASSAATRRDRRRRARRDRRALLRAARRRSAGRSVTMAEET